MNSQRKEKKKKKWNTYLTRRQSYDTARDPTVAVGGYQALPAFATEQVIQQLLLSSSHHPKHCHSPPLDAACSPLQSVG